MMKKWTCRIQNIYKYESGIDENIVQLLKTLLYHPHLKTILKKQMYQAAPSE